MLLATLQLCLDSCLTVATSHPHRLQRQASSDPNQQRTLQLCSKIVASCNKRLQVSRAASLGRVACSDRPACAETACLGSCRWGGGNACNISGVKPAQAVNEAEAALDECMREWAP